MALFCSCGHNRLEHVAGDRLSDSRVDRCEVKDCTCSKYHGAIKNDNGYLYKFAFRATGFFIVGIAAILIGVAFVDLAFSNYDVILQQTSEPTFLVYENGTRVNNEIMPTDHKQQLADAIKAAYSMIIFIAMYVLGAIFLGNSYDYDKRRAIYGNDFNIPKH